MSRHRAIVNAYMPCQETVVVQATDGSYHRRFVPGKPVYNVNVTLQNEPGVKLGEPVTVIIGPEPETVELGTIGCGWNLDWEAIAHKLKHFDKPGKWRVVAMRVEE